MIRQHDALKKNRFIFKLLHRAHVQAERQHVSLILPGFPGYLFEPTPGPDGR
jgi:hypothetical protein